MNRPVRSAPNRSPSANFPWVRGDLPRFAARDALRGREVVLSDGQAGLCEGVGPGGELRVRTPAGVQAIHSSEVSVRPRGMALP